MVFAREKLQADFLQMRDILEETHPGLYDYIDKAVLDSLFDQNYARIDSAMEFSDFLMLQTEVICRVGCGHSSLWVPGVFWNVAPEGLFPLQLHIEEGKMFVKAFYADTASVPIGSEIQKINGEVDMFRSFMDSVFFVIEKKGIKRLILDQTGIMVGTARVGRYTAAVQGMDPRRGVIPDYPVGISQEDLVTRRDPHMEKALSLAAE